MPAPNTVYKDFILPDKTTTTTRDIYVAAFLQNPTPPTGNEWGTGYFNEVDIPPIAANHTVAVNKILDIFKLDRIYPAASGSTGSGAGFIGAVSCSVDGTVTGSNVVFHNANTGSLYGSRYSGRIYQEGPTGPYFRLLNDAGLNTLPDINVVDGDNVLSDLANNGVKVIVNITGSFYGANQRWGVKVKADGSLHPDHPANYSESAFTTIGNYPIAARSKEFMNERLISGDDVVDQQVFVNYDHYFFIAPNRYLTRMYVSNEEGTIEIVTREVTMKSYPVQVKHGSNAMEAYASNTVLTRYLNATTLLWEDMVKGTSPSYPPISMTIMTTDAGGQNEAANGIYLTSDYGTEGRTYFEVDSYFGRVDYTGSIYPGQVTGWAFWGTSTGEPPAGQELRIEYNYYNPSTHGPASAAYNSAVQADPAFMEIIYWDTHDQKFYTSQVGGNGADSFVQTGYYIIDMGYDFATCSWIFIQAGVDMSSPRLNPNVEPQTVGDLSFSGYSTEIASPATYVPVSTVEGGVSGTFSILGIPGGGSPVASRSAAIWLRRTNSANPTLNEEVSVGLQTITNGVATNATFSAVLTKGDTTYYDYFTFFEKI